MTPDPDDTYSQLRALWHHPLLQAFFAAHRDDVVRSSLRMRPPTLTDAALALGELGEWVLASHDDPEGTQVGACDHVCSVRLRGYRGEEGLVVGAAPDVTLAAVSCLVAALQRLDRDTRGGLRDIDEFLADL